MMKRVWVYKRYPIDFGWEFLRTLDECMTIWEEWVQDAAAHDTAPPTCWDVGALWAFAQEAALSVGWEGDVRGQARVMPLPVGDSFEIAFAFKQENNGDTFIVSPVRLQYLEGDSEEALMVARGFKAA
jgi:hypothetical protein